MIRKTWFVHFLGCLSKLVLNSGASWGRTAEITPVKTVGSVLTVWMVQYVSVKQASKETGMSRLQIHEVDTLNYLIPPIFCSGSLSHIAYNPQTPLTKFWCVCPGAWVMLMSVPRTPVPTEACARTHTAPTSATAHWVSAGRCVNSAKRSAMNSYPTPGTSAWRRWLALWSSCPASSSWSSSSSSSARRLVAASQRQTATNSPEVHTYLTPFSRDLTLTPNSTRTSTLTSRLRSLWGPSPTLPAFQATQETTWTETHLRAQLSRSIPSSPLLTQTLCTATGRPWLFVVSRPISPLLPHPTQSQTVTPSRSQTGTMIMTVS